MTSSSKIETHANHVGQAAGAVRTTQHTTACGFIRQTHRGNGSCHCYHVDKLMEEMGQAKDSISKLEKSKGSRMHIPIRSEHDSDEEAAAHEKPPGTHWRPLYGQAAIR